MKRLGFLLMFLMIVIFMTSMRFSSEKSSTFKDNPRLTMGDIIVYDQHVEIPYEINFGGFVELHLYNDKREKIWVKRIVNDQMGEYVLRIARKPLENDKRYSFELKYKGRDYYGSFTNKKKE